MPKGNRRKSDQQSTGRSTTSKKSGVSRGGRGGKRISTVNVKERRDNRRVIPTDRGGSTHKDEVLKRGVPRNTDSIQHAVKETKKESRQAVQKGRTKRKEVNYKRQMDLYNPFKDNNRQVVIIGAGNIGSQTAVALARMGVATIGIFDHDIIEEHNITSQSYTINESGELKVSAIERQLLAINPKIDVFAYSTKFSAAQIVDDSILISAVDSLKARKEIAKLIDKSDVKPYRIIDGRMGGGQMEVYTFEDTKRWMDTLPSAGDPDPCGSRFISYTSMMIGAIIANNVKRIMRDEDVEESLLMHIDTFETMKLAL